MNVPVRRLVWAMLAATLASGRVDRVWALGAGQHLADCVHQKWTRTDGLAAGAPTALAQTPDGYVWIGTQDGLVRFDGRKFLTFDAHSVPLFSAGGWVRALAIGDRGELWIGTDGGLLRYEQGRFTALTTKEGLSSDNVRLLVPGLDRTLWVATIKGVDAIRDGKVVDYPGRGALTGSGVSAVLPEPDGALWVVRAGQGLGRLKDGAVTAVGAAELPAAAISRLARDSEGTLFVSRGNAVYRRDGEHFVAIAGDPKKTDDDVLTMYVDRQNTLWLGRTMSGVASIRNGRAFAEKIPSGVDKQEIYALLEDHEGSLWVASLIEGIHMFHEGAFRVINPLDKGWPQTFASLEARDGTLWLGSFEGGLFRIQADRTQRMTANDGLPHGSVCALHEDPDGRMFVGAGPSVATWDGHRFSELPDLSAGGEHTQVSAIAGHAASLWVAKVGGGVYHRTPSGLAHFSREEGLPSPDAATIFESSDHTIWVGTGGGLARFADGRFAPMEPTLPAVYDMEEDGAHAIWIATLGGPALVRDGKVTLFPASAGFPSDVHTVAVDTLGFVWFASDRGICRLAQSDFARFETSGAPPQAMRCFDETDGLAVAEADAAGRAVVHFRDGRLGFATPAGLAVVDPRAIGRNATAPRVQIQSFDADGAHLDLGKVQSIAAGTRQLRIDYAALTYTAPKRVRYRYRLEGYDRDWVEAGENRSAHYTNLAPDDYRFIVTAENGDGVWSSAGASLSFRQRAYFYETWTFYVSVALALAAGATTAYRLRVRQLQATATALEKRVSERTVELRTALAALEDSHKRLEEKDHRLHEDLVQAERFQRGMLTALPASDRVRFAALYHPAELVGGDIYDVAEIRPGVFRLFLADTTGHGVQASLRTMIIKMEYDRVKREAKTPSVVLTQINERLLASKDRDVRCTACCIDVEPNENGTARVVYSNAAHPELLHIGIETKTLYTAGMYLGFLPGVAYTDVEATLGPGDILIAYSDAATEEQDGEGTMFGNERLVRALERAFASTSTAHDALLAVRSAIQAFVRRDGALSDDLTMLAVQMPRTT